MNKVNLVKASAEIVGVPHNRDEGVQLLKQIEMYARLSHRSGDKQTPTSWGRFLQAVVMEHGDLSVVEHVFVTAYIVCDRGISHEIVRHRVPWQYTQESTRFCNYGKAGQVDIIEPSGLTAEQRMRWDASVEVAVHQYLMLVNGETLVDSMVNPKTSIIIPKLAPQLARDVLPNALATRLYATSNLRGWRHFFLMRTSAEAHPRMREITTPLLAQFQSRIPLLFDDIMARERQSTNMKKLR